MSSTLTPASHSKTPHRSNAVSYLVPNHPPESPCTYEEIIKGSRFITRLFFTPTVEKAKSFIKQLHIDEPDATHHCWAYIIGNPASTTLIACSDDGEPNGTAGMPMLNVLQHSGLGDVTVVVTRYFGGTKLGTGGLARAYGGCVKGILEKVSTHTKIYTCNVEVVISYELQNQIRYLFEAHKAHNLTEAFSDKVVFAADIPQQQLDSFLASLQIYENKQQLHIKVDHDSA